MLRQYSLLVCLVICSQARSLAATQTVLGASVSSSSAGSGWATELHLTNLGASDATINLTFLPDSDGTSAPTLLTASQTIPVGTRLVLPNTLNSLWSLTDASGTLRIDYDQPLAISARKLASTSLGLIGTALPIVSDSNLLESGNTTDALWLAHSADPATGFSSNLWICLAAPNSSADLTIFDPAGEILNAITISGGPDSRLIPLASLLSSDLPIGRATLRVTAGLAAAALELTDNQTGDRMAAVLGKNRALDTDFSTVAQHAPGAHDRLLQTDARLVNLSGAEATLTIRTATEKTTLTMPPRAVIEIIDLLGTLQSPAAFDQVRFSSNHQMLVDIRTASVTQFGQPGILGEIHAAPQTSDVLARGATAAFRHLPADSLIFLNSWGYVNTSDQQIALKDPSGNVIASTVVLFDSGLARRDALADLFPGITLPEGATIEVSSLSLPLDSSALTVDSTSGDVAFLPLDSLTPESVDASASCPTPTFNFANAAQPTLPPPGGAALLQWSASSADSVDITPGSPGQPAIGTYQTELTTGTVFTLTANNACGSTATTVTVAVGPPSLKSGVVLTDPEASSATPGQLLSLQFDNLAEPDKIAGVVFKSADGLQQPATMLGVGPSGDLQVLVPLWLDSASAQAHRTGDFQVSALFQATPTSTPTPFGSLPFTIDPLTFEGDPVAAFQARLDEIAAALQTALTMISDAGFPELAAAQKALIAKPEAELRAMLSGISTKGSATLVYGWNPTSTAAITATVTKNDLALLLAYNANLSAALDSPLSAASLSRNSQSRAAGGSCLITKVPLIGACKYMADLERLVDPLGDALNGLDADPLLKLGKDQAADYAKKLMQKGLLGAVTKKMTQWITPLQVLCLISPIRLQYFKLAPTSIPFGNPKNPGVAVAVRAFMKPATDKDHISAYLDAKTIAKAVNTLGLKGISKDVATAFMSEILKDSQLDLSKVLADLLSKLPGAKPDDTQQVGSCDLETVYPLLNGPSLKYVPRKSVLEVDFGRPYGEDDYFFIGRQNKKETLCINPNWNSFLFSEEIEKNRGRYANSSCQFTPQLGVKSARSAGVGSATANPPKLTFSGTLQVGPPTGSVELTQAMVESRNYAVNRATYLGPVSVVGPLTLNDSYGLASSSVTTRQTADGVWTADLVASSTVLGLSPDQAWEAETAISLRASTPPNRDSTEQINIQITPQGKCDVWTWKVIWTDENFAGYTLGPSPKLASGSVNLSLPQANFATLSVDSHRFLDTDTCSIHIVIQLSDKAGQPQP